MDSTAIFFLCFLGGIYVISFIYVFFSYFIYRYEHKHFVDDEKPIPNIPLMEAHCYAVHTGSGLYQMLDCGICPYKEECRKYELRYGHYPNGMVDSRRKNNEDKGE